MTARAEAAASTRERIVQAGVRLLFANTFDEVTLAAIAQESGVSHQTVLNHFGSKNGVATAAVERIMAETEDLRERAVPGDLEGAIRIVVEQYELSGDSNVRWAMASERLGDLAPKVEDARKYHKQWLTRIFEADIPRSSAARRRALNALHAATDVYTWKLLRRDLGLSRKATERAMADLVAGVLRGPTP